MGENARLKRQVDLDLKERLTKCLDEIGLTRTIRAGDMSWAIADSQVVGVPELTACLSDCGLLHDIPFGNARVKLRAAKVVTVWIEKKIC